MSRIRRDAPSDSGALFELTREFATSFLPQVEAFQQSFDYLIKQDDALLLVVVEADQLLGHLLGFDHHALYANGRVSWVEEIMVRSDRRRCGLGRDLMLHFEQWAAARGGAVLHINRLSRVCPLLSEVALTCRGISCIGSSEFVREGRLHVRERSIVRSAIRTGLARAGHPDSTNGSGNRNSGESCCVQSARRS